MQRSIKDYFIISLKGIAMGAADVVPGVSGGTIAFISGIYEELINSINQVNFKTITILKEQGLKKAWESINGNFLLALLIGIGLSIASLARLIKHYLEQKPILVWSFFFGLVLASIIYVAKQITSWNFKSISALVLGGIVAYFITTLTPQNAEMTYPYILFCGALAICAMILPGISGGYILLLLGAYKPVLDAIHEKNFVFLGVLAAGAISGLLLFSRVLKWLFERFENITLAVLTGFIIGSLNKIWPWKQVIQSEMINGKLKVLQEESVLPHHFDGDPMLIWALVLGVVGFVVIILLEKLAQSKQ